MIRPVFGYIEEAQKTVIGKYITFSGSLGCTSLYPFIMHNYGIFFLRLGVIQQMFVILRCSPELVVNLCQRVKISLRMGVILTEIYNYIDKSSDLFNV